MPLPPSIAQQFTPDELDWLTTLRRELHRYPELSWQEETTASRLVQALNRLGASDVRRVAGTGVVARIPGQLPGGPVVAIRADIDALPVAEATGLPFASEVAGVMHACGHDLHATWAIGAALLLCKTPAMGDVLILLQPAEETAEGAIAVLEDGALEGVAAIFGGHVDRRYQVGQVVAHAGAVAASADFFKIELSGEGAHGARPHEAKDPIIGAGALIGALQTLVSRRIDPAIPAVVTVATIHAGTADNIIPDRALLTGTIRTVDAPSRALLLEELRLVSESVAAAHHLTAQVSFAQGTPPIVNPPGPTAWARDAVRTLLGAPGDVPLIGTNMGGEDFAFYLERIPGCFLRVGAREPGGPWLPAHSAGFLAAEESAFIGAAVLAETARRASSALTGSH
jgi:hippurate hydrolase